MGWLGHWMSLASGVWLAAAGISRIILSLLSSHCSNAPSSRPPRAPERFGLHVGRIIGSIECWRGMSGVRCVTGVRVDWLHSVGIGSVVVVAATSSSGGHVVISIGGACAVTAVRSVCASRSGTETGGSGGIRVRRGVMSSGER